MSNINVEDWLEVLYIFIYLSLYYISLKSSLNFFLFNYCKIRRTDSFLTHIT